MLQRFRFVLRPHKILSTRQLGELVSLRRFNGFFRVRSQLSQSRCLSLFSWRSLASRVYLLLFPRRGHKSPPTLRDLLNPHLSLQRRRFLIPRYVKRPDIALYAVGPLFLLPTLSSQPCTLNVSQHTICFGNRPPLIRISAPAPPKSLLVRNVVSMLTHPVILKARGCTIFRRKRFDNFPPRFSGCSGGFLGDAR